MIGLGVAEFRLPLLIGVFGFVALQAVVLNKAMSLIVVATALPALPARVASVPLDLLTPHWSVVLNLLGGSVAGARVGATWATKMRSATLYKVLSALLVLIAFVLLLSHLGQVQHADLAAAARVVAGLLAGFVIGVVAALIGVAGGELLIPTIVLLYGLDFKVAGSLSLPTMVVAFARYSRDRSFDVPCESGGFVLVMAAGSLTGTIAGVSCSVSSPS
ncbi:sulfite exporter TauE/SafE family protein [Rhodococcoides corynebacterioides]|uniref:Probable membrane transporter protein n=1 Tax=Rhodococcoides corynebacterioides TaxID=53972 RepID=A0ABS7NZA5_9NOCA|nr:sulfite exporter TauE/SafE family protein [Rhodococcus corynebacterioides]MBY6349019.1 sulfite exporter TauE/SafE family protein [Rhodococcus corynebacterioides]MBY6365156.1 sulfite exporter TauE/SafE family protein [Rhodococcus corynebacterioides]MBY6406568.1 sulfite exporter TauE/SafE family protein [Rhodococcus corynebacterioides]